MVFSMQEENGACYLQKQSMRLFQSGWGRRVAAGKQDEALPSPSPKDPKTPHSKHSHPLQQGISHLLKANQNTVKGFQLRFQGEKNPKKQHTTCNAGATGVALGILQGTEEQVAQT